METASDRDIFALDNVRLELPLAGVGSRILAALVDYALLAILQLAWLSSIAFLVSMLDVATGWLVAALLVGYFLLQWGYFAGLEIILNGQTLGKRAVGIRVIGRNGGRAGAGALVVRALLRSIDIVFGVLLMLFDKRSRRLGDILGGTLVVHDWQRGDDERHLAHLPVGWGAAETALVESFLRRADLMERDRAHDLAERLLRCAAITDPAFAAPPGRELAGDSDPLTRLRRLVATAPAP